MAQNEKKPKPAGIKAPKNLSGPKPPKNFQSTAPAMSQRPVNRGQRGR